MHFQLGEDEIMVAGSGSGGFGSQRDDLWNRLSVQHVGNFGAKGILLTTAGNEIIWISDGPLFANNEEQYQHV